MARILVVEDDPDITAAYGMILKREGHTLFSALTREAGMKAVMEHQPELIILDVMLEQQDDGFILAQDLRRKGVTTPILMLTSVSKTMGMSFGKNAEMLPVDEFAEKPIEPEELLNKVRILLKRGEA